MTEPTQNTREYEEIKHDQAIKFIAVDQTSGGGNLGCAEFTFCQSFKRGKIVELRIERRQQHEEGNYLFKHHGASELLFSSFTHDGEEPRVWRIGYCKEHKGQWADVYVPKTSSTLRVRGYSDTISVDFR